MPYTRLRYHLITATHERLPIITPDVEAVLYPALEEAALNAKGRVLQLGGVADHVHIVVALQPTMAVSDFMRVVKTHSSRRVRAEQFKAFRWQARYAAFTVSPNQMQTLIRYVACQKQHHAMNTIRAEYEL
jgi:REP element-mobilizing transposase RayT